MVHSLKKWQLTNQIACCLSELWSVSLHTYIRILATSYVFLPGSQEMCKACLFGHFVFFQVLLQTWLRSSMGERYSLHMNVCKLGASQANIGIVWFTNPNVLHNCCTSTAHTNEVSDSSMHIDPQGSWFLRISSLPRWVVSKCSLTILYSNESCAEKSK